jgi:hypothetical protein
MGKEYWTPYGAVYLEFALAQGCLLQTRPGLLLMYDVTLERACFIRLFRKFVSLSTIPKISLYLFGF